MKFTYRIEGMHCSACIEKIKLALSPLRFKFVEVTLNPPTLKIEAKQPPLLNELNEQLATAGSYRVEPITEHNIEQKLVHENEEVPNGLGAYYPIFLIAIYIFGITAINNTHGQNVNWQGWMGQFMAGFFFVFSAFKLLDIRGFAEGYATYDLLAR